MIENKIIPCERCGSVVAMLIFAPEATDSGRFEDYARKMYPQYPPQRADLDHWPCNWRRATHRPPSRCAESVADEGANPAVAACAIQSAAGIAAGEVRRFLNHEPLESSVNPRGRRRQPVALAPTTPPPGFEALPWLKRF